MKILRIISLASTAAATALVVSADEVTDYIAAAGKSYADGNYSEALQSLDIVGQLIRQKKAEAVIKILPKAPAGWTAGEPESEGTASLMGGMVSAKCEYRKGDARIELQVQSDSPLLQALTPMFANPMMLTASGAKLELVKGVKYAVTYSKQDKNGDAKSVIDNRYVVTINGNEIAREDLMVFAQAIDSSAFAKLK